MKKITTLFLAILLASTFLTTAMPIYANASSMDSADSITNTNEKIDADLITPYNQIHPIAGGGFQRVFTQYGNSKNANTISKAFNQFVSGAIGIGIKRYVPWAHSDILGLAARTLVNMFGGTSATEYYTVTTYIYYGNGSVADRTRVVTEVYRDSARKQLKARRSNFLSLR